MKKNRSLKKLKRYNKIPIERLITYLQNKFIKYMKKYWNYVKILTIFLQRKDCHKKGLCKESDWVAECSYSVATLELFRLQFEEIADYFNNAKSPILDPKVKNLLEEFILKIKDLKNTIEGDKLEENQ